MTRYTVQCSYAAYYTNTVTVEADTLEDACSRAVAEANNDPLWSSRDVSSNTFIDALAEGDDVDLWSDAVRQLPVPNAYSERGEGPLVVVAVSGGTVQSVTVAGGAARVETRDYDLNGADPSAIRTDAQGRRYALRLWSDEIPPQVCGG